MKRGNLLKLQTGAIVVEATFVLPIVIIVIFILVYMALFEIQQSFMYLQAQMLSQKITKIILFPGYEELQKENNNPSISSLDRIYQEHDPYRYLGGVYIKKYESYENEIADIIKNTTYLSGNSAHAKIDTEFSNLSTAVTVLLTYNYKLPSFVKLIGLNPNIEITAKATTYANDSVDFIRNADLSFDLIDFLLQKYQLKDKINIFYEKMSQASEKLF